MYLFIFVVVWVQMQEGNCCFVVDEFWYLNQDVFCCKDFEVVQYFVVMLFGCFDFCFVVEIIFDFGLGDLFVVCNVGQVIGELIVVSLEYVVVVFEVFFIVVFVYDLCGVVCVVIDGIVIDVVFLLLYIWKLIVLIVFVVRKVFVESGGIIVVEIDFELVGCEYLCNIVYDLLQLFEIISNVVVEG